MSTNAKTNEGMAERKAKHLEICTDATGYTIEGGDSGFSKYRFVHRALPELNAEDIDTSLDFLGKSIALPFFISSMTGGSAEGFRLNRDFATLAQSFKIPVGMGSIRICFRQPEVIEHFQLRSLAPDVPICANLGAVQIRDMLHSKIIEMLKRLEVDALTVHLNPAQELFQPEGDRDFAGITDAIQRFAAISPVPLIIKETGAGIGAHEVVKLLQIGAAYVNIAGSGGTNWATVESYRAQGALRLAAADFGQWGNPTALVLDTLRHLENNHRLPASGMHGRSVHQTKAVQAAEASLPKNKNDKHASAPSFRGLMAGRVLASGGIRNAHDLAISLALGAYCGGAALPLARAVAKGGRDAGALWLESLAISLRGLMLLTASPSIAALRAQSLIVEPAWRDQVEQYVRLSGGST